MRALFVHSARFVRTPEGGVYSNGQFAYEGWLPYLNRFDELTVVGRVADCAEVPAKWNLSSGPRVRFAGTPDDHGKPLMQLNTKAARRVIAREVSLCDAVIVRQSALGWLAAREAERIGKPWAVEVVSDAWNAYWNYGSLPGKLYAPVAWWGSRYWIGRADFAIYVTREYLQKKYPNNRFASGASDVKIAAVPSAVLERKTARIRNVRPEGTPLTIGLIGSLFNRYKGLDVALRALRRLSERGTTIHLRVLGDGHLDRWRGEAEQLGVAHLLHLDGALPSGEPVLRWLDALDLYIQPSFQEGLPRSLVEAMSRGLPALGSICGGIPELLPAGCLHRPGDDKTLAEQLQRMVHDPARQLEQAKRNFNEARSYYSEAIDARRDAFWTAFAETARKKLSTTPEASKPCAV